MNYCLCMHAITVHLGFYTKFKTIIYLNLMGLISLNISISLGDKSTTIFCGIFVYYRTL